MSINVVLGNANGLLQHLLEVKSFLYTNNIDILLVSDTLYEHKLFKIQSYTTYHTMHPDGTAHGGTAIITKITAYAPNRFNTSNKH